MKIYFLIFASFFFLSNIYAQTQTQDSANVKSKLEAACGQCMFGMKDNDCKLAVRIKGKAYLVKGADIDSFGDAHKADGFCNMIRMAAVQGRLENDSFKVTSFKLLPLKQ